MRFQKLVFPLLPLIMTTAGCSERVDVNGPGGGELVEIDLMNFRFNPSSVEIDVGDTVRWTNTTSTFHTITPDGHSQWSQFQTNTPDQSFEVTFNNPGTYDFFCTPHQSLGMMGSVVVR